MTVQISSILLGVRDLERSKKFYSALGARIDKDYPVFASFKLGDGSSELGLYPVEALAADAGVPAEGSGFRAVTLNYIVGSAELVDETMAVAERSGAREIKPPQKVQYGYFGYFADPDGHLWKVAASA